MASNERRVDICNAIMSFISWLARLLSSFYNRSQPLEELPIVTFGSQQTMALLEAFHKEDHNSQAYHRSTHVCTPLEHQSPRNFNVSPNERRMFRSATAPISIGCPHVLRTIPISPLAREKPLSNYPTAFRWTSPITPPDQDWEKVRAVSAGANKVHPGIGDLGTRRGFKGKPLIFSPPTTESIWPRSSAFLSLPKGFSFSPKSSSVSSPYGSLPSSPRTPLEMVTNRMRSVSVSMVSWSSGSKSPVSSLNDVPQNLQELYDTTDPFASYGDSFLVLNTDAGIPSLPKDDFSFHRWCGIDRKSSRIGQKNVLTPAGLHAAFTNSKIKTTIYDLSTADVVPARGAIPVVRKRFSATLYAPCGLNHDGVTALPSPTIVLTAPTSPEKQEADADPMELINISSLTDDTVKDVAVRKHRILQQNDMKPLTEEQQKASGLALSEVQDAVLPSGQVERRPTALVIHSPPAVSVPSVSTLCGDLSSTEPLSPGYVGLPKMVYDLCDPPAGPTRTALPGANTLLPCPAPAPQRRSSLRPLMLPARVASRLSARVYPIPQDDTAVCPSQGLEGIIALLDVGLATP